MNKFLGLFLTATFLVSISSVWAMDDDLFENTRDHFLAAMRNNNVVEAQESYDILYTLAANDHLAAHLWLSERGSDLWLNFKDNFLTRSSFSNRALQIDSTQSQKDEDYVLALSLSLEDGDPSQKSTNEDFLLAQTLQSLEAEDPAHKQIVMASPQYQVNHHPNIKQLRERFQPIATFMTDAVEKRQDSNVHFMDGFYAQQVGNLIAVADEIFPENGGLSIDEIREGLKKNLTDFPYLFEGYTYQGTAVTIEEIKAYIDKVYQPDMIPHAKLCSHAFNLAFQGAQMGEMRAFHLLLDSIAENYITKGGCLPGRHDRQFVVLSSLLMSSGL